MGFADAVTRLNSGDLELLLGHAAELSSLEFHFGEKLDLFPALNPEIARAFADAILASRAGFLRSRTYSQKDLAYVINNAMDGLTDPRLQEEIGEGRPRDEMLRAARAIFSRWANIQLRQQIFDLPSAVGRAIGFLDLLPTQSRQLDDARATEVGTVAQAVRGFLGSSAEELARVFMAVNHWYQRLGRECASVAEQAWERHQRLSQRYADRGHRLAQVVQALLDESSRIAPLCSFSADDLWRFAQQKPAPATIARFLELFSADVQYVRRLREEQPYVVGANLWRLSPLERFPLIRLPGARFVAPNVRFLLHSFSTVLDYSLLEALGGRFDGFRGAVLELHLRGCVSAAFPNALVVPERQYRRGKYCVRGPDLILGDAGAPLVLIEAKARRVAAEARSSTSEDALDKNLSDVYAALKRLPQKVRDMAAGLPEYGGVQAALSEGLRQEPLFVCVLPETIYFLTEQIRQRADASEDHPLHGLGYAYCVLSVATFEIAVAVSRKRAVPLAAVLKRFWEQSGEPELSGPAAELFDDEEVDARDLYAANYISR